MMKSKALTGFLSLVFPGLGHLYIGRYIDGIVFLLGAGVLWGVVLLKASSLTEMESWRAIILWGGLAGIYLYALIDAVRKAGER